MCGKQIGFNYNHNDDIIGLLYVVQEILNKLLEEYKISIEEIELIHLIF